MTPKAPPRFCGHPNCQKKVKSGNCAEHKKKRKRLSAHARGYGERWRQIAKLILMRDRICRICRIERATEADHIIPKSQGGNDSMRNLQGLCKRCHARKTAGEDGGFGNTRKARK